MPADPLPEDPESTPQPVAASNRRLVTAMLVYAGLAILAAFRLGGRPRLVVWLFLGLFAFKTLLSVLKQKTN